jgi:hypothetical protein
VRPSYRSLQRPTDFVRNLARLLSCTYIRIPPWNRGVGCDTTIPTDRTRNASLEMRRGNLERARENQPRSFGTCTHSSTPTTNREPKQAYLLTILTFKKAEYSSKDCSADIDRCLGVFLIDEQNDRLFPFQLTIAHL